MTNPKNNQMIEALVQNYGFKKAKYERLPSMDFVYPDFTGNGNTEAFRFSSSLRSDLGDRASIVRNNFQDKDLAWTFDEKYLLEVDKITPRLGIEDQITGKINSIYSYYPILYVGKNTESFVASVVKPIIDGSMAWFELTTDEINGVKTFLEKKVQEKPYRPGFIEKVSESAIKFFGGKSK